MWTPRFLMSASEQNLIHVLDAMQQGSCNNILEVPKETYKEPQTRVCVDDLPVDCFVLSFGIAYNFLFDDLMLEQGCTVESYDPSMRPGDYTRGPKHTFYPDGLAFDDKKALSEHLYGGPKTVNFVSIPTILQRANRSTVDVMRIDIEGSEWDFLEKAVASDLFRKYDIKQIVMEVHLGWHSEIGDFNSGSQQVDQVLKQMNILNKIRSFGYTIFSSDVNLYGIHQNPKYLWKDQTFYNVYELGFHKKTDTSVPVSAWWLRIPP